MHRAVRMGAVAMAAALSVSGCYGPFRLTKKLHHWNGQVGDKWVNEAAFLVLAWVPVYGLAILGDAVIFNSIEFWGGKNPVEEASDRPASPRTKVIARGDAKALLTYVSTGAGEQLVIEQFNQGRPAESVRIQRRDGVTVASTMDGALLWTAKTLPDGGIVIADAQGKPVASYSARQVEDFVESSRRIGSSTL